MMSKMRATNDEVSSAWVERVCQSSIEVAEHVDWMSLWCGFVLALGRPDLTNYVDYMQLGYGHEDASCESCEENF